MSLMDEFEHLITEEVEETTFEQDSKNYIEKANRFIDDANRFNKDILKNKVIELATH